MSIVFSPSPLASYPSTTSSSRPTDLQEKVALPGTRRLLLVIQGGNRCKSRPLKAGYTLRRWGPGWGHEPLMVIKHS